MTPDAKMALISEIHTIFSQSADYYSTNTAQFLSFLFPAIVTDNQAELFGSSQEDIALYVFIKQNFDNEHAIWEFISLQEKDSFIVTAAYYTRWEISGTPMELESRCRYDIVANFAFSIESKHSVKMGVLVDDWIEFELDSEFFDAVIIRVDRSNGLRLEGENENEENSD